VDFAFSFSFESKFAAKLTKPPVIDTYTAYINHWKHAKEAVKTACQAKSAFAKFLGVSRSIIALLLLLTGVLRPLPCLNWHSWPVTDDIGCCPLVLSVFSYPTAASVNSQSAAVSSSFFP
jgi:hypothetical protein